jgi:hypothetical protein
LDRRGGRGSNDLILCQQRRVHIEEEKKSGVVMKGRGGVGGGEGLSYFTPVIYAVLIQ